MKKLLSIVAISCSLVPGLAPAETVVVSMAGGQYQPAELSLSVGDSLLFVNDDGADHNVFVPTAGYAFDLGKQEPGQEKTFVVGKAGSFDVECVFHPGMLLKVEVK